MDYYEIETLFRDAGTNSSAAEAHGIAAGMLCVDERADVDNWLTELFDSGIDNDLMVFTKFYEDTRAALVSDDYRFDLLLPDQSDELDELVEAMRDWCQGFLFGVGYSKASGTWPGEIDEILKDIVEITKIDAGKGRPADSDEIKAVQQAQDEEDRAAFMEINEYLRASVYLIREEFLNRPENVSH